MLHGVATQLHVGPTQADVQSRLRHLHGSLLVLDGFLQELDILFHVKDLLQHLLARV